jgi:DNA-binding transcriptional MerR regulator
MDLTGLSREKIEYMCTKGFIAEPRRKFSRSRSKLALLFFPVRDVLKALIIADIRAAGFSFQQVRKLAENLEELGVELDERAFLLTDGDSIQVADSNEQVVDVLRHKRQMYLLVSLEDQVAKLRA